MQFPFMMERKPEFDPLVNLDNISNLPLWSNGEEDAPKKSLAAVGYTAHTYKRKDGQPYLSLNVQWLVVLGIVDIS